MKILILGFGKSTSKLLKFIDKVDEVFIFDKEKGNIDYSYLENHLPLFDLTIRSPGIPINSKIYILASLLSKKVVSDIEFLCSKIKTKHIIGVTGTVGKTSTCKMIYSILSKKGRCFLLGNIGVPLGEEIELIQEEDYLILELSSFELENTSSLNLEVAVILNMSENHLDATFSEVTYYASKKRILFSSPKLIIINQKLKQYFSSYSYKEIDEDKYINKDDYNKEVAKEVARFYRLEEKEINLELNNFKKDDFRNKEYFYKGRRIVNDSKSTCVASLKNSLSIYSNEKGRIIILGGIFKSRGEDSIPIKDNDLLFTFGKDGKKFLKFHKGEYYSSLEEVIKRISSLKNNLDIIFSPACSSFDQYSSFLERGEEFDFLIKKWL